MIQEEITAIPGRPKELPFVAAARLGSALCNFSCTAGRLSADLGT